MLNRRRGAQAISSLMLRKDHLLWLRSAKGFRSIMVGKKVSEQRMLSPWLVKGLLCIPSRPSPWDHPVHIQNKFCPSVNPPWKHPPPHNTHACTCTHVEKERERESPRYASCIFMVMLNPVRLTMRASEAPTQQPKVFLNLVDLEDHDLKVEEGEGAL